jgi:DNA polymerase-3 subunit alpha
MAFATLEDIQGTIEVIIFSDLFKEVSTLIKSDEPVIVTGSVSSDEDKIKVIASKIRPLSEVMSKKTRSVHFHLSSEQAVKEKIKRLKELIQAYPGECPAYLHVTMPGKSETVISLDTHFCVEPSSPFTRELEVLFGQQVMKTEWDWEIDDKGQWLSEEILSRTTGA